MNWAQRILWEERHNCEIILKARQLGVTTWFGIFLLDNVLWRNDKQAGILAHTFKDATDIFKDKLKFAFDNLHPNIRQLFRTVGDSSTELSFSHGSSIRVGTSLRSSTLQYLHISEFGKICARFPEKAREVISGSLNTVHAGQHIFIESTAEGKDGAFASMWENAWNHHLSGKPYGELDFKPFFFPWWKEPSYSLEVKPSFL